ncbi:MAG: S1/P1 nuclease [Muribaculaceae bacterium]|nr:S1/P1 nuclease [Muribaculaceae bacterium]
MKRGILNIAMIVVALSAMGWGQKGHDVTAYIAEQHLTPATRAAVDSIFDGKSIVYWSNWLDNASHTPEYRYTSTWHYKNIDKGERYEEAQANPAGDAITALKAQIETLSDPSSTSAQRRLALKILVHVAGDIHQPMHLGHATDLGGNRITVKYFGRDNNLHSIWDSSILESGHKWSYTEWQQQLDRVNAATEAAIISGTLDDWAKETVVIADEVYTAMPAGASVSYNEVARWTPVIEEQLLRGGLRLAHLLNTLFDPTYTAPTAE